MGENRKRKIIGCYTDMIFIILFPLTIVSIILYFIIGIKIIESNYLYPILWTSLVIAFLSALYFLIKDFKIIKLTETRSDFIKTFFFLILFLFIFLFTAINWTNYLFDFSDPEIKNAEVIRKNSFSKKRKIFRKKRFKIYVRDLIDQKKEISIEVSRNDFVTIKEGDILSFKTKKGFWGLEYIDNN